MTEVSFMLPPMMSRFKNFHPSETTVIPLKSCDHATQGLFYRAVLHTLCSIDRKVCSIEYEIVQY